jgi:hypothetical protein
MNTRFPYVEGVVFKDILDYPGYCVGDDGSVWSSKLAGYIKHEKEANATKNGPWQQLKFQITNQ